MGLLLCSSDLDVVFSFKNVSFSLKSVTLSKRHFHMSVCLIIGVTVYFRVFILDSRRNTVIYT